MMNMKVPQKIDERLMGGIIRIDLDKDPSRSHPIRRQQVDPSYISFDELGSFQQEYYIPNDNPWQDEDGNVLEEFYAIGTRNPYRMSLDPVTGDIWVADVGQGRREEISIATKGSNLQWPFREGNTDGYAPQPDPIIGTPTVPIYDYNQTMGNSIIGGMVYRGSFYQGALEGKYIFGDHGVRNVWTYNPENGEVNFLVNLPDWGEGEKNGVSSISTNAAGEIFILKLYGRDLDGGVIYKLRQGNSLPEPPPFLSQTGAFADLTNLTPTPGIIPYEVNAPLWSDRALKKRWIAIPNDGTHDTDEEQIAFSEKGSWQFPDGTVFIKHFELPIDYNNPNITKRLETRFFILDKYGRGYGVTYKWNDEGTDAELLRGADTKDFEVRYSDGSNGTQTWAYPSRANCMTCHTGNANFVLGVQTWQLNGEMTYPSGIRDNQLNTWDHLGIFANPFDANEIPDFLQSAHINDTSASLETRVRSYLDANCASCHRPDGVEGVFDARFSTPLEDQNIIWTLGTSRNTPEGHYIVRPLDVSQSEIWIRDGSLAENLMPPLAKSLVDDDYMEVLTEWINSLEEEACIELSATQLSWLEAENKVGPIEVNASNGESQEGDGQAIMINGEVYPLGFGVHAPSTISYQLGGAYSQFQAYVGVDDEVDDCEAASMQFEVYADDNKVAQSPILRGTDDPFLLRANISGANIVKLVVTGGGDGTSCDHGDWGNPLFFTCNTNNCAAQEGQACDDGNDCTTDDQYDNNCKCFGVLSDTDEDSVPDGCDQCPGSNDLLDEDNDGVPDGCDPSELDPNGVATSPPLIIYTSPVSTQMVIDYKKSLLVNIRPNPFRKELQLFIKRPTPEMKRASIKIVDVNGRIVFERYDAPFDEEIRIEPHSGWVNGVYIMQVRASEYTFTQAIVKH